MIEYSPYELIPKAPIESKTVQAERNGALLRIHFQDGKTGYADCHPWTELGDESLTQQLQKLRKGVLTPLTKQSLHFARCDAEARAKNENLFIELSIPKSHFLIPNILQFNLEEFSRAIDEGFACFKIKLGRDLPNETKNLCEILNCFRSDKFIIRLDFNLKLSSIDFEKFLSEMARWKEKIEFCEDPFPFDPISWQVIQQKGLRLACDMNSHQALAFPLSAQVIVLKPAIQDSPSTISPLQNVVFTSYLDHPLGQLAAAYSAAKYFEGSPSKTTVCGLLSHHAYLSNAFSERLSVQGPDFKIPLGTGFGYDDLLPSQKWQAL